MPVTMEGLTRPWAEPQVQPKPSKQVVDVAAPTTDVVVHIGSPGGKTFTWHILDQWQLSIGPLDNERTFREVSKTTQTIHVTNPSDANQFVDIDQVKHIEVATPSGILSTYDFKV